MYRFGKNILSDDLMIPLKLLSYTCGYIIHNKSDSRNPEPVTSRDGRTCFALACSRHMDALNNYVPGQHGE